MGSPNARGARQRLSKRGGRDAAPSASDFCGGAAFVKQYVELEKIVVCRGDGAVRLRFGSATARQPYQFGTTGSRRTCKWRGSAFRIEMVGMTSVSSDFCGAAAPVKQHIELEKIVVRPGDGASLRLGGLRAGGAPEVWVRCGLRLVAYASESEPTLPFGNDGGALSRLRLIEMAAIDRA